MKDLKINGNKVVIWDSIEEMPCDAFQEFNRYILIDIGIGSDIHALNKHISDIARLIKKDDVSTLKVVLNNYSQSIQFIQNKTSPRMLAFIALIKEFNGVQVHTMNETQRSEMHRRLNREKKGVIDMLVDGQKKNLDNQVETFFRERAGSSVSKEYYALLKKHIRAVLNGIPNNDYEEANTIYERMLDRNKPIDFQGPKGYEVTSRKSYESLKLVLSKEFGINTDKMTVIQFYQGVEEITKQTAKQRANGIKSNKSK